MAPAAAGLHAARSTRPSGRWRSLRRPCRVQQQQAEAARQADAARQAEAERLRQRIAAEQAEWQRSLRQVPDRHNPSREVASLRLGQRREGAASSRSGCLRTVTQQYGEAHVALSQ
jgi:hypothetical protein